jgi:hypothetical protein
MGVCEEDDEQGGETHLSPLSSMWTQFHHSPYNETGNTSSPLPQFKIDGLGEGEDEGEDGAGAEGEDDDGDMDDDGAEGEEDGAEGEEDDMENGGEEE